MEQKEQLEARLSALAPGRSPISKRVRRAHDRCVRTSRQRSPRRGTELLALDDEIAPLAIEAGHLRSPAWGLMMRAGADKSLLARQVERYADIYTSRVSNLLYPGPVRDVQDRPA